MANLKSDFGLAILLLYGGKEGGNYGGILVHKCTVLYTDSGNFYFPHFFYKIVFKNDSPLGFMIENYFKKPGLLGVETPFIPQKNEMHSEKNEVHI